MKLRLPALGPQDKASFGLALLAGAMGALGFPNYNLYPLVFLFPLPLLWALERASGLRAYWLGVCTGTLWIWLGFYWVGNWAELVLGWPLLFAQLFAGGYALVMAQSYGLVALLATRFKVPLRPFEPFVFPVLWVLVQSLFPWLFPFRLADSQSANLSFLQPVEWTGVWGAELVILLVGTSLYKAFAPGPKPWVGIGVAALLVGGWGWVGYGSLQKWDQTMSSLPAKTLGLVQTNRPASLEAPEPEPGYSRVFPWEMELSHKLAEEGAEVLFWPEGHFYGYAYWLEVRANFQAQVATMGIPLFFLDSGFSQTPSGKQNYNTTFVITGEGRDGGMYHKRHLVPFGEYTPWMGELPWIKGLLGDFLADLSAGTFDRTFEAAGMRITPKICYEVLYPEEVAQAIGEDGAGKVILVQSQDGWYGRSSQPEQHLAVSVVRAIENRVPLVHVINNGPSSVILPQGRYAFKAPPFEAGHFLAPLPYDPNLGGSFYSRHPTWFLRTLQGLGVFLLGWGWWKGRSR
ncbi:MAG: apolipoprotein N-acyltransferase [Candidatus Lambdaproteobacteria bacterium RIFOXYD1_FULL_56_27]|uniref:Apolipoprotein N-acyltransferase n=1 Tax=Candidatus Lambdaproteobacteria bacterium RIFOXYD2_FULL_56_26 TaxID=1817773 RepID=A0A1F6H3M5_9PROT|nr:MAG: apolipoprotein N-acyltransferase [Candidatus Lambdaproteobacteria bacterium RIFOXYC1_FULL_56_13]OGH04910.1 MAG: apolipoprotein N-acyltransferase [Candidatus Lambdaproteobacteria bacterium RIFOXYD2_FULL_56_26]OGH09374.1 MAG: apolipoprotein N-acyltransferase [Candidatus Lambdaproteobacteria bacterium RIFOXYD1_FULL_56_27]